MPASDVQWSVVLPRRVVPQPQPHINPSGDCAACTLAGLVGWDDVQRVYAELCTDGTVPSNWDGYIGALQEGLGLGLLARALLEPPYWPTSSPGMRVFGDLSTLQTIQWQNYLLMGLEGGYYGVAKVDSKKAGAAGHGSNHVVLLCGARQRRVSHPTIKDVASLPFEVLVSCSSTATPAEEWVEANAFLRERGGFNLIMVRPSNV